MAELYYKNDETGGIGIFTSDPGAGWTELTQKELDAYLLDQTKAHKVVELDSALSDFKEAGYAYTGAIVCLAWQVGNSYAKKALVNAGGANYVSLVDNNKGNDPPSSPKQWASFFPKFKLDDDCLLNLESKEKVDSSSPDRFKYYTKGDEDDYRHLIDFGFVGEFNDFTKAFVTEHDRVMLKYNDYRSLISACSTVAEVDAIVIDFSA